MGTHRLRSKRTCRISADAVRRLSEPGFSGLGDFQDKSLDMPMFFCQSNRLSFETGYIVPNSNPGNPETLKITVQTTKKENKKWAK